MKKLLSVILALALCLSLGAPALAEDSVVVSPQNLAVDGKAADCEKYNINGSNYFKLRDMAMLLRGTPAAFGIDFDAENFTVKITRGGTYEQVGGELKAGADNSATCVPSTWKLLVDGEAVEVSTFNIGGSNFYKLRDMGDALGFAVDFDAATNTAVIYSDIKHTAVASGTPFFEDFPFSAPAEHEIRAIWYVGDTHDPQDGVVTASAPVITRSAPDGAGNVIWTITYTMTGRIEFPIPKNYKNYSDFGVSHGTYDVFDYYTGAHFDTRVLTNTERDDFDTLISVQGTPYKINYVETFRYSGHDDRSYSSIIIRDNTTVEIEITAPADYDGLVLGLRSGTPLFRYVKWEERSTVTGDGGGSRRSGLSRWDDYDNLSDWFFVRLADYAQAA